MLNTPESLAVRFMLIKNYCAKLRLFYLKYKNAAASSRLTDKEKEQLVKIEHMLRVKDENMMQASRMCINDLDNAAQKMKKGIMKDPWLN